MSSEACGRAQAVDSSFDSQPEPKTYVPSGGRAPLGEIQPNAAQGKRSVNDEGSQTVVSGNDIEENL